MDWHTVVCVASGPSLTAADCALVEAEYPPDLGYAASVAAYRHGAKRIVCSDHQGPGPCRPARLKPAVNAAAAIQRPITADSVVSIGVKAGAIINLVRVGISVVTAAAGM